LAFYPAETARKDFKHLKLNFSRSYQKVSHQRFGMIASERMGSREKLVFWPLDGKAETGLKKRATFQGPRKD
jgi:hypothetical protein